MKIIQIQMKKYIGVILVLLLMILTGCSKEEQLFIQMSEHAEMQLLPESRIRMTQEQLLEAYIQSMSLEEKVGQLFYVTIGNLESPELERGNQYTELSERGKSTLHQYYPGGVILMGGNIQTDSQVSVLTTALQENSEIPLFIGVDEEGGTVSRLGNAGGISMGNVGTMREIGDTGDPVQAYETGEFLADGLVSFGFNMDFAPVADVLTNSNNYEIGPRSFGTDASLTAAMVSAEVQGLQANGVSAVAKHFPGHGGVIGNSHNNLQYVETSIEELRQVEFLPFQAAIQSDTDAILISHLVLTAIEPERPSTLSQSVVTGLLRDELGYEGVVITDSFQMGSITENYNQSEAAVLAVQAGCDMVLMPMEYSACYQGVLEAVRNGTISEEQIDEACFRILAAKIKRGILTLE
ncbi:MAG: glycoside hydrolase family 3 protein [Lachnospiraceae bacterium]|nr:glycoside hydrolase family 3 protein [Lachnospiraceae bacterium]